jgi:hypothetical protein
VRESARCALQSIWFSRSVDRIATSDRPLIGLTSRSESPPRQSSAVSVEHSRYAVSHSLGSAVFPRRADRPCQTRSTAPLFEFRLRLESSPAKPSRRRRATQAPLMGFHSLQHMRIRRSTHRERYLPASFRPQGLLTLSAVSALRIPVGFISHRQRSWDSPFGAFPPRKVSDRFRPDAPTDRSALECSRRRSDWPAYRASDPGF